MYFIQNATIGLASKSPRRIELLKLLGINFDIITNNKAELKPNKNELPKSYSIKTSNDKLKKIKTDNKEFIIAADTIIAFQNQIFGKPINANNAFEMLSKFSKVAYFRMLIFNTYLWHISAFNIRISPRNSGL